MAKKEQKHEVIVYRGTAVPAIDVMVDGETVWLTLGQMARLFGRDMSVIGKHVKNVFAEGELPEEGYRQNLPKISEDPEPFFSPDRKMIGFNVVAISRPPLVGLAPRASRAVTVAFCHNSPLCGGRGCTEERSSEGTFAEGEPEGRASVCATALPLGNGSREVLKLPLNI